MGLVGCGKGIVGVRDYVQNMRPRVNAPFTSTWGHLRVGETHRLPQHLMLRHGTCTLAER